MLVAALVMVVGIAVVAALSHRNGYRLGGVMVLPLLAVYTFREPLSPLVFVVGAAVAWGTWFVTAPFAAEPNAIPYFASTPDV